MKRKHREHKGESIIGKIIYAFLLFIPLFAIGSTILINTFNSEAKTEAEIVYKYETNEVNSINDLKVGNIYTYTREYYTATQNEVICNISYASYEYTSSTNTYDINVQTIFGGNFTIEYWSNGTNKNLASRYYGNTQYVRNNNGIQTIDFVYLGNFNSNFIDYVSKCENIPIERVENKDLNNVFYNSIEKVKQSDLFAWTKNSVIYTGISNTAKLLSITDTFIPMLLTYWLIISVFYFLYDIVLMCVLVIHKKIHELQDSI